MTDRSTVSIENSIKNLIKMILESRVKNIPHKVVQNNFSINTDSKRCIKFRNLIKKRYQRASDPNLKQFLNNFLNKIVKSNIYLDRNN